MPTAPRAAQCHTSAPAFAVASVVTFATTLALASPALAAEWFVAPGGTGSLQSALDVAQPGDTVTLLPGTYPGASHTVRAGISGGPITVRAAQGRGSAILTAPGEVLQVDHAYLVLDGLVFDGQYGAGDTLDVNSGANGLVIRDVEVRRSGRDCIDMGAPQGVVIERSLIHHCLNATGGRTDAHGIVAGAVRDLTIRDTEVHTFSGDGFQVDPARSAAGWDRVVIERSKFWLAPLPAPENGFAAGVVPGENAVDTKVLQTAARARLTIRDVEAWGFRAGLITNMAAFNLKENIEATVDRVTVRDSEIAFRLRGPASGSGGAWVTLINAVIHSVATAVRYEDNLENFRFRNSTIGAGVTRAFQAASSSGSVLDVRNVLVLATAVPAEAGAGRNLAAGTDDFLNVAAHDYHLAPASDAVDSGEALNGVPFDRDGTIRPQGLGFDIGAYESPAAPVADPSDVVLHALRARNYGAWRLVSDATAAGGSAVRHPDAGARRAKRALANPADYFELTFTAVEGVPYRLWIRGKADANSPENDSVFVQFSDSLDTNGTPAYRVGSASALVVELQDCRGCALSGWGWQDTATGSGVLGPTITFAATGMHTIRVQTREDGLSIDQVVISPNAWLTTAPGAPRNDATILPESQ